MDDDRAQMQSEGPDRPRGWAPHPRERMLITPLVAGLGGLLAFFTVVFIVVWLPIHTFDPPASYDWTPLADSAVKGRNLFAANNCYVCHSGYSRPQDVREALYFLYPKVSQPGDFYGSDQSPNLLGTERTGPDLSQESGWHPDDWQRAHFYDPRFMDPLSLMPSLKSLFSDKQVEELVAFVEQRSGKSGLLRYAGQLYAKHIALVNQGFPKPCVGFHGLKGDGKGPGARFLSPPPADFTDKDDACCGGDTGPGDFYYRILRGWPGTAMENFGDRLSVDDIWRVVLFLKTIPNHTLQKDRVPEPSDYIVWQPSKDLVDWLKSRQKQTANAAFDKKKVTDPFMQEAMRVFPGLAPGDSFLVNDRKTR